MPHARLVAPITLALMPAASAGTLPPILDHVPPVEGIALIVPSIDRLDDNAAQLTTALEQSQVSTLEQALSAAGFLDGLDTMRGAALLLPSLGPVEQLATTAIAIVPLTPGSTLLERLGAKPDGDLRTFTYDDVAYFVRALDETTIAVSADRDAIVGIDAGGAHAAHHEAVLGPVAGLIGGADVALVASPEALGAWMAATAAGSPERIRAARAAAERFARENHAIVIAATASPLGARIDAATVLAADSPLAAATREPYTGAPPLDLIPAEPYLFAAAGDLGHPVAIAAIAVANEDSTAVIPEALAAFTEVEGAMDGGVLVLYEPSGGLLAVGIFDRGMLAWRAPDHAPVTAAFEAAMGAADESLVAGASYRPIDPATATDTSIIATWHLQPSRKGVGPSPLVGMRRLLQGIITTSGDRGAAATDGAGPLARRSVSAEGETLATDRLAAQLLAVLPPDPIAVWFLDPSPVLGQIAPVLGLGIAPPDLPASVPPIAGALSAQQEVLRLTVFLPVPTLRLGLELMDAAQANQPR